MEVIPMEGRRELTSLYQSAGACPLLSPPPPSHPPPSLRIIVGRSYAYLAPLFTFYTCHNDHGESIEVIPMEGRRELTSLY